MAIIKISDGNAFKLRVTAMVNSVPADLNVVTNMIVNFVRRGRLAQPHGIDVEGRLVISNDGSLARGIYGVEVTGYHDGKPWRHYIKDAFKIVDENEDSDTPSAVDDVPIYDISDNMNFGGDGVTAEYVNSAISAHDSDDNAHPDLQQMIAQAGSIDDVQVNGHTVVQGKVANITMPNNIATTDDVESLRDEMEEGLADAGKVNDVEVNGQTVLDPVTKKASITIPKKVSELTNDSQYQTASEVDEKVAAAAVNEVNVSVDNTAPTGQPSAEKTFQGGVLDITFKNVKGDKGDPLTWDDLTDTQKASLKGAQGDSFQPIEDVSGLVLAHVLGDDNSKAMSQQGVSELMLVRDYIDLDDPNSVEIEEDKRLNNATTDTDAGKWMSDTGSKCMLIPVKPGKKMALKTKDNTGFYYAFINNDAGRDVGKKVTFANDYTYVVRITNAPQLVYLDVPSNAKYLYLMIKTGSGSDQTPTFVAYIEQAKDKIVEAESKIDNLLLRPLEGVTEDDYSFGTAGTWGTSADYKHARIPVKEGEKYIIKAPAAKNAFYAFVTTAATESGAALPLVDDTEIGSIRYSDEALVVIPKGAKYLVVYNNSNFRPFNIKKVDVGERGNVKTITPKLTFESIHGETGDYYFAPNDQTSKDNFEGGKLVGTPRFIKTSEPFTIKSAYAYNYVRVFFYDDAFNYIGDSGFLYYNQYGDTIDEDFAFPYSYIKIIVRNSNTRPFYLASLTLTGVFDADWDVFNPRPSDQGWKRISVLVNVTDAGSDNEETQEVQDTPTYMPNYGAVVLPETYSHEGKPTRLIIYSHGASTHYNVSTTTLNANDVEPEYWLKEGYAVMDVDGNPYEATSHAFIPAAMDCYVAAYKWVIEHYNICRDGVFLGGRSMGGGNTLHLLKRQCPIPVIAACANLPTSLALSTSASYRNKASNWIGYKLPEGFSWSSPAAGAPQYNDDELDVILDNWNKFISYTSITPLIIDMPTDENWRRAFALSCSLNNMDRITLMQGLHAIARAPLKLFGCYEDPNNDYRTAVLLYKTIFSNSGQIVELRMFHSNTQTYTVSNPTAHTYDLNDPALRTTVVTRYGEEVSNVPVVYVEMLRFWRRYEQEEL